MIIMDSDNELAIMNQDNELSKNLCETYLVTENGNERLGNQKLDLKVLR